ncbi:hypothetical protein [Kaarinaea lacus]
MHSQKTQKSLFVSKIFLLFLLTFFFINACSLEEDPPVDTTGPSLNSRADGQTMHTTPTAEECPTASCAGQDCAACHGPGNVSIGNFTVSGSVFDYTNLSTPYNNALIKLYTGPNGSGDLVKALEVDMDGNFYTTDEINWKTSQGGLFPVLSDLADAPAGHEVHMPKPVVPIGRLLGSCNACHRLSAPEITNVTPGPDDPPPSYIHLNNGYASYATATSHRAGEDCLASGCHDGTSAGAAFTTAGTVYDNNTSGVYTLGDAAIGLFPDPCIDPPQCVSTEGVPSRTHTSQGFIEVDTSGNFYTTKPIDWTAISGIYPTLANYDVETVDSNVEITCRNIQHMSTSHNQGNCATTGCHTGANTISIDGLANAAMACVQ